MPGVLVASPDQGLLSAFLADPDLSGVDVHQAVTGRQALGAVQRSSYELVVLDERLAKARAHELLPDLVAEGCGVLVLSSSCSEPDLVLWLELGADDVVSRPYSAPELRARVHAILRRRRRPLLATGDALSSPAFSLEPDTRSVMVRGRATHLPPLAFAVLKALGARNGVPVPREVLLEECWSLGTKPRPECVDAVIRRLRKHIEPDPSQPEHIVTVRSKGYALRT